MAGTIASVAENSVRRDAMCTTYVTSVDDLSCVASAPSFSHDVLI